MPADTQVGALGRCVICENPNREWIEILTASGQDMRLLAREYQVPVRSLQVHEHLHSSKIPQVDPVSILIYMRWLMQETEVLVRRELSSEISKRSKDHELFDRRLRSIQVGLAVAGKYADLVNVKKYIDPHVVNARWAPVTKKLMDRLKDFPEAQAALAEIIKEEGPKDREVVVKVKHMFEQPRITAKIESYRNGKNGENGDGE